MYDQQWICSFEVVLPWPGKTPVSWHSCRCNLWHPFHSHRPFVLLMVERGDEGKASAGHYELLVEGSYRAMELPLEVAHILDHSHKDDEEHEVVNRTDPKVEPDTLQEDSCSIPANSSCQSRLCTYSLFCVCVNRYIYKYIYIYTY